MTDTDDQETMVLQPWAMWGPDGLAGGTSLPRPAETTFRGRGGSKARLTNTVLAHLPLAVMVMNADARLLYWNEQAAGLFGAPPLMAAESPPLATMLAGAAAFTPAQRDRIAAFCATRIAARDRAEPNTCLRLSLERARWLAIQVRELGFGRWMLVIDDGRLFSANFAIAEEAADACLDCLTGLSNRRHLNQILRAMEEAGASPAGHAVLMIDLDRFKPINDTLGHAVGDALLCLVAQRLRRETREEDLLVRLGGDEFVILLPDTGKAEALAGRVVDILSRPFLVEGHLANISASVGIAKFPEHGASADELMRHADLALYDAKAAGRRAWRVFDSSLSVRARDRLDLETDLRKALILGELSVAYQPQLNVRTQTLGGFEALLRWNHPTRGSVAPSLFIPVAEEIGCIMALGQWVLMTACTEAARWPVPMTVAVNVSPRQFEDSERLFNGVQAALAASGLPSERLELEITETSLLSRESHVLKTLHRLRAAGIRIAMDDFGTGHSSLSQLRSFPFDKIKIDRSFVSDLGLDGEAAAVIRAIAALGSGLGMTTTAEGVETACQAALVEADGCTDIQGYLVSRPIPACEIDALLSRYSPAEVRQAV